VIRSKGDITVDARFVANGTSHTARGGSIELRSERGITVMPGNSSMQARGGSQAEGGSVELCARSAIVVAADVDVGAGDGGDVDLTGRSVAVAGIDARGIGDAGDGGFVFICAEETIAFSGLIRLDGSTGLFQKGGSGGELYAESYFGDISLALGGISARGASPDGIGGGIELYAAGSITIEAPLDVGGPVGLTTGGEILVQAEVDCTLDASAFVNASGGESGGSVEFDCGRDVTLHGSISVVATARGGYGGFVFLEGAYRNTGGLLTIESVIDASSNASCSREEGCGVGGCIDADSCNVHLSRDSHLIATGPRGGEITLEAASSLHVEGNLDATRTVAEEAEGTNSILHASAIDPVISGTIVPPPDVRALPPCTGSPPPLPCADPCPNCGDGRVEPPETCDPGEDGSLLCHGCDAFCRTLFESACDDGRLCTEDSCDPLIGCRNLTLPGPCVEEPRPTPTTGPTRTATPSVTGTPPTATATRTRTSTRTATATVPTPSRTRTRTRASSRTPSARPTEAATSTTATPTPTLSPTPSPDPGEACIGDCDGDGTVAVGELITCVSIALGVRPLGACVAFERKGTGSVSVVDLLGAVAASLSECSGAMRPAAQTSRVPRF
jgi:hypothetical protein